MANFSSFFPTAASGGGGFTKMNKYSTFRALDDATNKLRPAPTFYVTSSPSSGANTFIGNMQGYSGSVLNAADAYVGMTFVWNSTTHTISASTANAGAYGSVTWTFSPTLTASIPYNQDIYPTDSSITVNPATDLGLSDGDSLGYFLCGAGNYNGGGGGKGGKINYGTAIISNASTDLVLTPGVANSGNSTITGGLTLTSGDGSNMAGGSANASNHLGGCAGILGYGAGGGAGNSNTGSQGEQNHGWGGGGFATDTAGDGAILLYY